MKLAFAMVKQSRIWYNSCISAVPLSHSIAIAMRLNVRTKGENVKFIAV